MLARAPALEVSEAARRGMNRPSFELSISAAAGSLAGTPGSASLSSQGERMSPGGSARKKRPWVPCSLLEGRGQHRLQQHRDVNDAVAGSPQGPLEVASLRGRDGPLHRRAVEPSLPRLVAKGGGLGA